MIRSGLIGYGLAGKVFHAPLLAANAEIQLQSIATTRSGEVRADYPDIAVTDASSLIADPRIDLVVIATPNDSHADLAAKALAAGKAVIVDKPVAPGLAEAERLVRQAERAGQLFCAFHNRRWDDDFLTLQQALARGELGEIVTFESRFDRFRPEPGVRWRETPGPAAGIWWDLGPHLVDQALLVLGAPHAVTADLAVQRVGAATTDYFHVTLHYESGRRAILRGGCMVRASALRFSVEGTGGAFVSEGLDPQESRRRDADFVEGPRVARLLNATERTITMAPGDYGAFYSGVCGAILRGMAPPVANKDMLAGLAVLEAAEQSAARGVTVSLPAA